MRTRVIFIGLVVLTLPTAAPTWADTIPIGPYNLDEHAFPDQNLQVDGPAWGENSPAWMDPVGPHCWPYPLQYILIEQGPQYWWATFGLIDLRSDMTFELRFTNNAVVNLPGADLVIFEAEMWGPGGYMIAVPDGNGGFTAFHHYGKELAVRLGQTWPYITCGSATYGTTHFQISTIEIDLSDFGVADGASISAIRYSALDGADPALVGAIHSSSPVPVQSVTWGRIKSMYR